jgi:peptidoglycan/LPS O-acetylase OafA/YrhL
VRRASLPRAAEIDGIRGWASLIVLLYHAFREMLHVAVPAVAEPLLAPAFASDLAVSVFFVLSGDALSLGFFHGARLNSIDRLVVRRYFRLTIPILMSCFVTYAIMKIGIDYHAQAARILGIDDWLGDFLHFSPSFYGYLKYSLLKVYTAHTRQSSYNPFLWTMSVEMIGSMLVFLMCYLWPRLKNGEKLCIFMVIGLIAIGSFFALFFAGMLFSSWRRRGVLERFLASRLHQYAALVVVAVCLISYALAGNPDSNDKVLQRLMIPTVSVALVFCAYTQRRLKAFFCNAFSRFLGVISFPVYLLQFQVLISLDSWLVLRDYTAKGHLDEHTLLVFALLTVVVTIAASWIFSWVERFALRAIDRRILAVTLLE